MSSPNARDHAWLPRASCDMGCLRAGGSEASRRLIVALRVTVRASLALLLAPALPLLALPLPGRSQAKRIYCRHAVVVSRGADHGVGRADSQSARHVGGQRPHVVAGYHDDRRGTSGKPVAGGAASFVGRADVAANLIVRMMACIIKVIPIERASLRQLPGVVDAVAARLRAGQTVVAFPEGTTWCGLASGPFYPAMFQAAVDTGRPVQPLRLRYHHRDGRVSTVPAYIGDDTLLRSIGRLLVARRTVARVYVESLQLPGDDRRELARRCQAAIRMKATSHPGHGQRRPVLAS